MKFSILSYFFLVISIFYFVACGNKKVSKTFELQVGDLLFQDLDGSSLSEAIEDVTANEKRLSFSHIGIATTDAKGELLVLEAIGEAVKITSLDQFLARSLNRDRMPKVRVARLKKKHQSRIKKAMFYGESCIGLPYDSAYLMFDSTYYCSELIYEIFKHSGDGSDIFKLNPMTFKNSKTNESHPIWIDHYKKLGIDIPEGKPGCNPNGMSESKEIDWVFDYSK